MPRSSHKLTATLLATIYLVVGPAGTSLYYLVEADSGAPDAAHRHSDGYFHHHGDALWHHHRTSRRTESRHAPTTRIQDAGNHEEGFSIGRLASDRLDHSCLLLALVSQIQQSVLLGSSSQALSEFGTWFVFLADSVTDGFSLTRPRPRGPPGCADV